MFEANMKTTKDSAVLWNPEGKAKIHKNFTFLAYFDMENT